MIINSLNQQIIDAMKAHDEVRVSTLKMLSTEIHNYQIDHPEMSEAEELSVIKKEAKKRKDSMEAFTKADLIDRVKSEEKELKILQEFLPAEVSNADLQKFVDEAMSESSAKDIKDMGRVIGLVMAKSKGNADGGKVAQLVKQKLA